MARASILLPRESEEVYRRAKRGDSIRLIATDFGVSETAVSNTLKKRGFEPRKIQGKVTGQHWTLQDQRWLEDLMNLGASSVSIAEAMGRPLPTIKQKLREIRLKREGVERLEVGKRYRILQRQLRRVGVEDQMRCRYEGEFPGVGVRHHLFRSMAGGYLVAISDRQMNDYEIREDGK